MGFMDINLDCKVFVIGDITLQLIANYFKRRKTEYNKLLSAWSTLAKMAANGIETVNTCLHQPETYSGSRARQFLNAEQF